MQQYPECVRIYRILIDFAGETVENIFHTEIRKGGLTGAALSEETIFISLKRTGVNERKIYTFYAGKIRS